MKQGTELHISVLASGSSGNVTFVSDSTARVLLDAGLACREIETRLKKFGVAPRDIDAVALSHEHSDHAKGAWQFCWKHKATLYATRGTHRLMKKREDRPVEWVRVRPGSTHKLGKLSLDFFPVPHDAADPVGFRVRRGRVGFGHVTDVGHISEDVVDGLRGTQAILIESNHDVDMLRRGPYPDSLKARVGSRFGHLSNDAVARYLEFRLPATVRHVFLAHLSQNNNHAQLAIESCREALDRRGGEVPRIHLTYQDRATPLLRVSTPRAVEVDASQGVLAF